MLEALSNDQFVETFGAEMKRRNFVGMICCIMDTESMFLGCYPKEWKEMEAMPLPDQLMRLAAYTLITQEKQRYVVGEEPRFEVISGGKQA